MASSYSTLASDELQRRLTESASERAHLFKQEKKGARRLEQLETEEAGSEKRHERDESIYLRDAWSHAGPIAYYLSRCVCRELLKVIPSAFDRSDWSKAMRTECRFAKARNHNLVKWILNFKLSSGSIEHWLEMLHSAATHLLNNYTSWGVGTLQLSPDVLHTLSIPIREALPEVSKGH